MFKLLISVKDILLYIFYINFQMFYAPKQINIYLLIFKCNCKFFRSTTQVPLISHILKTVVIQINKFKYDY